MPAQKVSTTRLRIGIIVWIFSYLPFPVILLAIEHNQGNFTTPEESSKFIAVAYGIQFLIGFIGLFIAGSEAIKLVKHGGWRPMPGKLWRLVIHGELPPTIQED